MWQMRLVDRDRIQHTAHGLVLDLVRYSFVWSGVNARRCFRSNVNITELTVFQEREIKVIENAESEAALNRVAYQKK